MAASFSPVWWFVLRGQPEVDGVLCFDTSATEICKNEAFVKKLLASVTTSCKTDQFSSRCQDLHTLWIFSCLFRRTHSLVKEHNVNRDDEPKQGAKVTSQVAMATNVDDETTLERVCPVNALVSFSCINVRVRAVFRSFTPPKPLTF